LFASSSHSSSFADTVHRLSPFSLHPCSTGGLLVAIGSVPLLCIVISLFSGWNIVVYPSSDNLYTLTLTIVADVGVHVLLLLSCWVIGKVGMFSLSFEWCFHWGDRLTCLILLPLVSSCLHCKSVMLRLSQWPFISQFFWSVSFPICLIW
jgi:hypothetical protein